MGAAIAIVPAAGESRRMGALKPLLPLGSTTVIQTVVRSLKASRVGAVIVVLGHRAAEVGGSLADEGALLVHNPAYRDGGMLSSIQAGIRAAHADTDWFVIALGDQPALRADTVDRLLDAAENGGATILVPSYAGRRGHPLVLHRSHRAEIEALDPKVGLRQLMQRHADAIRHVEIGDPGVLTDMDTPADYQREMARQTSFTEG